MRGGWIGGKYEYTTTQIACALWIEAEPLWLLQACRSSYQGQEKTNPACSQYNAVGLGNAANRAASHPDYQCPAAGGRKLLEV